MFNGCFGLAGIRRKIWFNQVVRLLISAILAGLLLVAILHTAHRKDAVKLYFKTTFNVITTGIILLLGLNFFDALKDQAKIFRWKILARRGHSKDQVEQILGFDSLINVYKLWRNDRSKLYLRLFCLFWILINLSAQVSVASISFTYSFDDGRDWNGTYLENGTVQTADLSSYIPKNKSPSFRDSTAASQSIAHLYGETSFASPCGTYSETSDILHSKYDYQYYCKKTKGQQEFAFRFSEYNIDDSQKSYPHFTNRIITASSGHCFDYAEKGKELKNDNNSNAYWYFTYGNTTGFTKTIWVDPLYVSMGGTTFLYLDQVTPEETTGYSCGPRCIWVSAHRSPRTEANQSSTFYQCPISISEVTNATDEKHQVSNNVARLAAASISVHGRWFGEEKNPTWTQAVQYTFWSPFEIDKRDPDDVGALMAEFAIRSIATMASENRLIRLPGLTPKLGASLQVKKLRSPLLLVIGILVFQALCIAVTMFFARNVVIPEDSHIVLGQLLRPVIDYQGPHAKKLDEEPKSEFIADEDGILYRALSKIKLEALEARQESSQRLDLIKTAYASSSETALTDC